MSNFKKHSYAVILAGGSGTRFWPLSRQAKPKQFLNLVGAMTLLEGTIDRISSKFLPQNILIVTNKIYKEEILKHAKAFNIPSSNILFEPSGKNTAPAILWAAHTINQKDSNAIMAVLPSDHLILKNQAFLKVLDQALKASWDGFMVILGITPTRPDTGFGYLKTKKISLVGKEILKVEKFTEKPDLKKAKKLIKDKNYFWNSGMFFTKTSVALDAFKEFLPKHSELITSTKSYKDIERIWSDLTSVSIDYGILEKSKNVVAIESKGIGWSDVGSWEAAADVLKKDKQKNIHRGEVFGIESQNNLIFSQHRFVATIGVKDLIIIDAHDALLICRKSQSQKVREVVAMLAKNKKDLI